MEHEMQFRTTILAALLPWLAVIGAGCSEEATGVQQSPGGSAGHASASAGSGGAGGAATAATGGLSGGGSGAGNGSGNRGGAGGTAADRPPEFCYASCLWDLISQCRPKESCIIDTSSSTTTLMCEPATGWLRVHEQNQAQTFWGSALCYTVGIQGGDRPFFDANGQYVGGEYFSNGYMYSHCDGEVDTSGNPVLKEIRRDDPACVPWLPPDCSPGSCQ